MSEKLGCGKNTHWSSDVGCGMNVVVFDEFSDRRRGTVAGDEADLCRLCDIFFVFVCRVLILSYDTAIFFTDGEGVRSVVYVAMLFLCVCNAADIS